MKYLYLLLSFLVVNLATAQTKTPQDSTIGNPNYDKALAEKLGADDYGMKSYFLVILKTGSNTTADKTVVSESFRGHMENMSKLVASGKLNHCFKQILLSKPTCRPAPVSLLPFLLSSLLLS